VRGGRALDPNGRRFKVMATPGHPNFASTCIANAIAWRNGGNVAVLTPSRQGGFAERAVARVCAGPVGQHQNGPYGIQWESNDQQEAAELWSQLAIVDDCTVADALVALSRRREIPVMRTLRDWVIRRRSTSCMDVVATAELRRRLDRVLSQRRRHGGRAQVEFAAMTIQQAKNREFDHVIVLWPYTIPNDNEQRRRLLYNAITRAKRSCTVLVQSQGLLQAPPFVPAAL